MLLELLTLLGLSSKLVEDDMGKGKRNKQKTRRSGNVITRKGTRDMKKEDTNVFGVQQTGNKGAGCGGCQTIKGTPVGSPGTKSIPVTVNGQPAGVVANRLSTAVAGASNPVTTRPGVVKPATGQPTTVKGAINQAVRGKSYVPGAVNRAPAAPTFWETDLGDEEVKSCGVHAKPIDVLIASKARTKMGILMEKFARIEWLAYLVGDKATNTIEDIVIPKQRVNSVNVFVDDGVDVPIIGVIHSHHDMGNNFSGTDHDFINGNHDISLCISNTGIKGQVRIRTECGRFFFADAKCIDIITDFDVAEFDKEITDKISKIAYVAPKVTTTYPSGSVAGGNRGASYPHYGNGYGHSADVWDDFEGWDTDPASAGVAGAGLTPQSPAGKRELMDCVRAYREAIKGVVVDDYFQYEFTMLAHYIKSIDTPHYEMWELKAFDDVDSQYTAQYYALIDEISNLADELYTTERQALNILAMDLDKMVEVAVDETEEEKEVPKSDDGLTIQ